MCVRAGACYPQYILTSHPLFKLSKLKQALLPPSVVQTLLDRLCTGNGNAGVVNTDLFDELLAYVLFTLNEHMPDFFKSSEYLKMQQRGYDSNIQTFKRFILKYIRCETRSFRSTSRCSGSGTTFEDPNIQTLKPSGHLQASKTTHSSYLEKPALYHSNISLCMLLKCTLPKPLYLTFVSVFPLLHRGAGKVEEGEGEGLPEEEKDARRQELKEILESPTLRVYFEKYLKVCGPRTFEYLKSFQPSKTLGF